jgi:DNA invertase Pin-like site-specific DNA recombinase
MKAGYARVSTKEQTVDLQVDALKKAGCTVRYSYRTRTRKAFSPEELQRRTRCERRHLGCAGAVTLE